MLHRLLITCALVAGMTACLDVSSEDESTTEQSAEYVLDPDTNSPSCADVCGETATCSTACTDAKGTETTCYAVDSCDPVQKAARKGRNPLTGKTIVIKG